MDKSEKKRLKNEAKIAKKQRKNRVNGITDQPISISKAESPGASPAVRFAEIVRGFIYMIFGVTLILAVILREKGFLVSIDDIVDSLIIIRTGQVILIIIALAMFIYGLKYLRLIK